MTEAETPQQPKILILVMQMLEQVITEIPPSNQQDFAARNTRQQGLDLLALIGLGHRLDLPGNQQLAEDIIDRGH